ncbi:MAG: BCD family MFS transporter [Pseudomonadota bacterium]
MGWLGIFRMGLVQASLGAIVVLTTSTINRVMVVELMLPAMLPGALVALHYFIQLSRPSFGYASDRLGRRTPWIIGGMTILAIGGVLAALATALMADSRLLGTLLAVVAFILIGGGVGAAGTSMLALLAAQVPAERRAAAGSIVWIMMITGFVVTSATAGAFLDPFTTTRLVEVTACVAVIAWTVTVLALTGVEIRQQPRSLPASDAAQAPQASFRTSLREVWSDLEARQFTVFVFVSMLAYSTQDLILEPYGGFLFGMTPGETTSLSGLQHGGVFIGMLIVGIFGSLLAKRWPGILRLFIVSGCLTSGLALALLSLSTSFAPAWPLAANIVFLGVANGAFAVAAIGCMMTLAGADGKNREGIRMGVWGAAQAIAFGLGGFMGTVLIDLARAVTGDIALSYAVVFAAEAALFVISALIASQIGITRQTAQTGWAASQTPFQT